MKRKLVKLNGNRFRLARESDGAGDAGYYFISINPDTLKPKAATIEIGSVVRVGSLTARMYGFDWWQTTPVSEILDVNKARTKVKFKITNSIYIVEAI